MSENINNVSDDDFQQEILDSTVPVLVDFWAPGCGPCRALVPILEEIAGDYEGKLKVCKVNTDDNKEYASKYGIRGIPTIMIFNEGELKETSVGLVPKSALKEKIDQFVSG